MLPIVHLVMAMSLLNASLALITLDLLLILPSIMGPACARITTIKNPIPATVLIPALPSPQNTMETMKQGIVLRCALMGLLLLMTIIVVGLTVQQHRQKIQKNCLEIIQIKNVSPTVPQQNLMGMKMIENAIVPVLGHLTSLTQLK